MKTAKIVKYSLLAIVVILMVVFFHYNLPRTEVVRITGTDIKRVTEDKNKKADLDTTATSGKQPTVTRDVRFINTVTREDRIMVFRNEDTGWGWPPYFKFGSADVQAKAHQFMASEQKPWVRVKFYGWRIKIFSKFPNAVSLKAVSRDYKHFPLFNIVFLILFFGALFFLVKWFQRLIRRIKDRFKKTDGTAADAGTRQNGA
ncbi:MAG: DUF1523 family protein [Deltaproteobacteria bacterium]|nr:DUF1523 family protein [Deltaproteobacteria bacterium]